MRQEYITVRRLFVLKMKAETETETKTESRIFLYELYVLYVFLSKED